MSDKYNGWTNYETWNTHLWITNQQSSYDTALRAVAESRTFAEGGESSDTMGYAADVLHEWWEEGHLPDDAGPVADAWGLFMERVNWREIAEVLAE